MTTGGAEPKWIQQIHEVWVSAAPTATVRLRLEWQSIDHAALRQAAEWAEQSADDDWQPRLSAAAFESVLKLVAASNGDPRVTVPLRAASRRALQHPADEELIAGTEPLVRQILPNLDEYLGRIGDNAQLTAVRGILAMVAACLALPRVDILRLAGLLSPAADPAHDAFGDVLQAALDLRASDPDRSENLLVHALQLAALTSAPDNTFVLRTILQQEDRPLVLETLRACTHRLLALATAGTGADVIAWDLGIVAGRVNAAALAPELYPVLAEGGELLMGRGLSEPARLAAGLGAAEQWLRVGRLDRSDAVLWRLRQTIDTPACRLQTAVIESDARASCSDQPGARRVLLAALNATSAAEVALGDRRKAVLHLLGNWPVDLVPAEDGSRRGTVRPAPPSCGQPDVFYWVDEAERLIDRSEGWAQNSLRVQLLASLYQLGAYDRANALRPSIDFEKWRVGSADYANWTTDTEAWADQQAAQAAGAASAGDAGKDYTTLGLEKRFPEAAALADSDAALSLERGFRIQAYGHLVAAGRFYRIAGDREAALSAYERAITLLEHDLVYLPYAELVVSRLASWPELYQLSAVTALQLGDPLRAVSLAETGRSRATGSRLGVFRNRRPAQVSEADWDEFCRLWRHAVADAANAMVRTDGGAADGSASSPVTDRINELRRQFVQDGVLVDELSPVGPPVDAAVVLPRLASASRPTVVLYAIMVAGVVRFVRLTADGAAEVILDDTAHEVLVSAIESFGTSVRASRQLDLDMPQLLAELLAEAGPLLGPVLSKTTEGFAGGRLIWIPQGALVGLPLQALQCGTGALVDTVSLIVSSSLVSAIAAMEPDAVQPLRAVAIQGTHHGRQAPTEGGGRLLTATGSSLADEVTPTTLGQLNQVLAGRSLVHLACHGRFRWDDPLASTLQLRFDLSVGQLFDEVDVATNALVLLGTCDSGTIAQNDLNEGIGMPAALIAAGARTVVGAGWPVAAPAAVGICLKVLQGLARGLASPEALQQATLWIRDATPADLQQELAAVGHPMAERLAAQSEKLRHSRAFADPARWAAYLHWGGIWRGT